MMFLFSFIEIEYYALLISREMGTNTFRKNIFLIFIDHFCGKNSAKKQFLFIEMKLELAY